MKIAHQIARRVRALYFGGNWTDVNLKTTLDGVSWQQATTTVHNFNTIAALVYHTTYYIEAIMQVLKGGPLDAKDTYSFNHPPVQSEKDWNALIDKTWKDVETFATLLEQVPEEKLWETFWDEKYGSYYRNFEGIIEHTHYHLGQIVLIKKLLTENLKDAEPALPGASSAVTQV
jgi:uncharacterized damage-inducible protein DinB